MSESGLEFAASGYVWPPTGGYRVISPIKKSVRLFLGYMHILAAFLWFGTILYVHLLLKPAYAEKGLPKGEVMLGLGSMAVVGLTGILLTISRVKSIEILFVSPWGIVLTIKIIIYLVMVLSALIVVLFIGRKLKGKMTVAKLPDDGLFDPQTLSAFDGKEGRQALIAYKGKVYDMSELKLWKNGLHVKHLAGGDMTEFLPKAPHGQEKLDGLEVVGTYDSSMKPPKTIHQKIFYFIAYMNLTYVFLVLFVIAYWRWGI
ncbi:MAG: hypothetical protein KAR83_00225 [Thermodesulfovibrionales bacterium]|nr:hypothetical protein [Thermodesulfovibrionales bacterium]